MILSFFIDVSQTVSDTAYYPATESDTRPYWPVKRAADLGICLLRRSRVEWTRKARFSAWRRAGRYWPDAVATLPPD